MGKRWQLAIILILNIFTVKCKEFSEAEQDIEGEIPVIEGEGIFSIQEEDDVVILNGENFIHVVDSKEIFLVEFYAPWCQHCKMLEPEFAAAAKILKENGIRLGKVDCTVQTKLATDHGVTGFPVLKLFSKGKFVMDYSADRTSAGIVDFMRMQADPSYIPPPSDVLTLTNLTFDSFVNSKDLSLVEFYAPWCGHCKTLAPEYEGAATDLKSANIFLAKVDATEEKDLAEQNGVKGFPKLFVFRKGRRFEFKGPRTRQGIVAYMKEEAALPSVEVKTFTKAKNSVSRTEPTIFAYLDAENDLFTEYIEAANLMRGQIGFIHTFDAELAELYNIKKHSIVLIYPDIYQSKYEKSRYTFTDDSPTSTSITTWIRINFTPLVGQRTKQNAEVKYSVWPLVVVYYDVNFSLQSVKATQHVRNKILPLASANPDITFAVSNEEEFAPEMKDMGLDDSGEDVNIAIYGEHRERYVMKPDDDYDEELEEFIEKFRKGKLLAYMKSQPIPKRQDGPVKILVGKNFNRELESGKDFLVEFYAPWCGHCKELEPIYKKVAKYYAKVNKNVVIAKLDGSANDVDSSFEVKGFPTLFFVSGKDGRRIHFEGERTFAAIKNFVDEHSASSGKDEL